MPSGEISFMSHIFNPSMRARPTRDSVTTADALSLDAPAVKAAPPWKASERRPAE